MYLWLVGVEEDSGQDDLEIKNRLKQLAQDGQQLKRLVDSR